MKKNVISTFMFIIILLIIVGCFGQQHPPVTIDYYTLEYDLNQFDDLQPIPFVLSMERFSVSPIYNSNNIIYETRPFKLNTYNYHKWRANPGDMVTFFLSRDLKKSSLFKAIFEHGSRFSSSHIISGSVDEFFEKDERYSWKAVLSVIFTFCPFIME